MYATRKMGTAVRFLSNVVKSHKNVCGSYLTTQMRPLSNAAEPKILRTQENGVRVLTLNDEKKRNALSLEMLSILHEGLLLDADSQDLRVIVIRGKGSVFSAGHDLKELTSGHGLDYHQQVFHKCTEVMKLVQDLPVPVIAEVRGLATAAGCQLVASCDVAVATETARFATPGVIVGLFCSTPAVAVARAVPRKVAMEMLLTGQPISAQEALQHGLISRVVPDDQLEQEVQKLTQQICETSRSVVAMGKETFYKQVSMGRDSAYDVATATMLDNLRLLDCQEGIRAFIEKRHPHWKHTKDTAH